VGTALLDDEATEQGRAKSQGSHDLAESQPFEFPKEIPKSTSTTAGKNRPRPTQSKGTRAARLRLRG